LLLDNTSNNQSNRLRDLTQLTMQGGTFRVNGSASATTTETVGTLFNNTGNSVITVEPAAGQITNLYISGYQASGNGSVVSHGANPGGTGPGSGHIFFPGRAAGFIPFAGVDNPLSNPISSLAYYDPAVGVRVAQPGDFYPNPGTVIQNSGPVFTATDA